MTRRIYKYELKVEQRQLLQMPRGATILDVDRQGPLPFLWASVDPTQPNETFVIRMVTTGEVYNEERLWYIGHTKLGGEIRNGINEGWFEAWWFIVETALPQVNPDPLERRYADDIEQLNDEIAEATAVDEDQPLLTTGRYR